MLPDTALLGKIVSIPYCVTDAVQHRAGLTASVPGTRSFVGVSLQILRESSWSYYLQALADLSVVIWFAR